MNLFFPPKDHKLDYNVIVPTKKEDTKQSIEDLKPREIEGTLIIGGKHIEIGADEIESIPPKKGTTEKKLIKGLYEIAEKQIFPKPLILREE